MLFATLLTVIPLASTTAAPASLDSWNKLPNPPGILSIEYGNGVYAATTFDSHIVVSPDLKQWTPISLNGLYDEMRFINGAFVAIGSWKNYGPDLAISTDGVHWEHGYSLPNNDPYKVLAFDTVTYGNGKYVAIRTGLGASQIFTSPTAKPGTWVMSADVSASLWEITYGNGLYVAVGERDSQKVDHHSVVAYSTDAVNWTIIENSTYRLLINVAYGNGTFVATGLYGAILTSKNGIDWSQAAWNLGYFALYNIEFVNNTFIIVGKGVRASSDGTNWITHQAGDSALYDVTYGNGMYIVTTDASINYATQTFTVTYNGNGQTKGDVPIDSKLYDAFSKQVTVLGNSGGLTKDRYTFAGWNTQADGTGTSYAPGATFNIGADVTLYAQWNPKPTYIVTYDKNDSSAIGNPPASQSYLENETVTVKGNTGGMTKTDNSLVGWNTAADGSGTFYSAGATFKMGTTNVTLYAQWTLQPPVYYTGWDADRGSPPVLATYSVGDHVNVKSSGDLARYGYTFAGWKLMEGNITVGGSLAALGTVYQPGDAFVVGTQPVWFSAAWAEDIAAPRYTVTYNVNGVNVGEDFDNDGDSDDVVGIEPIDNASYPEGTQVEVLASPSYDGMVREGYIFAGWNTQADGLGTNYEVGDMFPMGTAGVTLYAKWNPVPKYTVTYDGNGSTGGTVPTDSQSYEQYHYADVLDNTGNLVNDGYIFAGWSTSPDGIGWYFPDGGSFQIEGNVTLYAQWRIPLPSYTIHYIGNGNIGGSVPPIMEMLPYGATLVSDNTGNLSKTGYTFAGWNSQADGSGREYPVGSSIFMEDADLTLYAHWTKNAEAPADPGDDTDDGGGAGNVAGDGDAGGADGAAGTPGGSPSTQPSATFTDTSTHWAANAIEQAASRGIVTGYPDGTFKPNKGVTRAEFIVMLMNALKPTNAGAVLTFTDADKIGVWAQRAIAQAVQAGMIQGYPGGAFQPDAIITRAEMAVIIANALGIKGDIHTDSDFADSQAIPAWAQRSAAYLKQLNIMQGKGDGQFAPDDNATRAEVVVVLLKMLAQMSK